MPEASLLKDPMGLRMAEPRIGAGPNVFADAAGDERWYAVQVAPRHEKKVAAIFHEKRLTNFLPLVSELHYWSDRKQKVAIPLFAGYTFVRFAANEERIAVLRTPGVVRLVGKDHVGSPIPAKEVEDVWVLVNSRLKIDPHPFLNVGDRVRIRSGSLRGVEGILVGKNSDATLIVSVVLLQRSLAVRIQGFDIGRVARRPSDRICDTACSQTKPVPGADAPRGRPLLA